MQTDDPKPAAASPEPARHPSSDKILDVAEPLFARSGFDGVGLRELAQESGLSKSSLFHHFPTKADLYCHVMVRLLGRLAERIETTFAPDGPAEERLLRAIDLVVDELAEHPPTARLLLRSLVEDQTVLAEQAPDSAAEADAIIFRIVDALQRLMQEGIERGEFREVSVPDATHTLVGSVVFYFASGELGEQIAGGSIFTSEAVQRRKRELREFVRNALAAR